MLEYVNAKTGTVYHQTLKEQGWWKSIFMESGFEIFDSDFHHEEYCRGVASRYQDPYDYKNNPETGFHFTAKKI